MEKIETLKNLFKQSGRTEKNNYRYVEENDDMFDQVDKTNVKVFYFDDMSTPAYSEDDNINYESWIKNWYSKCSNIYDYAFSYKQFLEGNIPASVFNYGSISRETLLIKPELQNILSTGYLTEDSQPSILLEDYYQKPYIQISSSLDNLTYLIEHIYLYYPLISLVTKHPNNSGFLSSLQYPTLNLYAVFFTSSHPSYLFNPSFFADIAKACHSIRK